MPPSEYTSLLYEMRDANSPSGNTSWRIYSQDEFRRDTYARFREELMKDLRAGAQALGLKETRRMTRDQLLDAIAQARWERLPEQFKR
jgi:hypothetical protein